MPDRSSLHQQVRKLWTPNQSWMRRAIVHALIELDQITEIKCMMPVCCYEDRFTFVPRTGKGLCIDHVNGRVSDEPWNLRLAHGACNATDVLRGHPISKEQNAKLQAGSRKVHLGAKRSPETCEKIRQKALGRKVVRTPESCAKGWETRKQRYGERGRRDVS